MTHLSRDLRPLLSILCLTGLLLLVSCGGAVDEAGAPREETILAFIGSAMGPPMEEIVEGFEEETGIRVDMIQGGSGTLLSQIEVSRRGDIYMPGSPDYIVIGERRGLLVPDSERVIAYLVPAIITPAGNPAGIRSLSDLARPGTRVGIGNPETVCLGIYGVEVLETNGLLSDVIPNVVILGTSCSNTASLAALGQVDAIIGWRVFHDWNPERMDLIPLRPEEIPRISHIPISIPVTARDPELSMRFIDYVAEDGREVFARYGYITDEAEARRMAPSAGIGGEYTVPEDFFDLLP